MHHLGIDGKRMSRSHRLLNYNLTQLLLFQLFDTFIEHLPTGGSLFDPGDTTMKKTTNQPTVTYDSGESFLYWEVGTPRGQLAGPKSQESVSDYGALSGGSS